MKWERKNCKYITIHINFDGVKTGQKIAISQDKF